MAEHRAKSLSALLPIALATGYSETAPYLEPLKVRAGLLFSIRYLNEWAELRLRPHGGVR